MTGIASAAVLGLDMKKAAKIVKEENARVASLLGIKRAARCTTVKPAGTTSLTLGTSSGIHAWHNDYYLRRIRVGKNEAIYSYLAIHHPELVEDEFFRPHDTAVIAVPQMAPVWLHSYVQSLRSKLSRELSLSQAIGLSLAIGLVAIAIMFPRQSLLENMSGIQSEDGCGKTKTTYNGLSVLPYDGGTYTQAPFEDIDKREYDRLFETLQGVDLTKVIELTDETDLSGEAACAGGACEVV